MSKSESTSRIQSSLQSMPIGHCGEKWGMLVWRTTETTWQVGEAVFVGNRGFKLDDAVHEVYKRGVWTRED